MLAKVVLGAFGLRRLGIVVRPDNREVHQRHRTAGDLVVAVDNRLAQKLEQLGGTVAATLEIKERRRGIDERRDGLAREKAVMVDNVFDERDVRLDAADAKLAQGSVHPLDGELEATGRGGQLNEERIVKRRDHRAGVAHGTVQADTEARGATVIDDLAVVRREVLLRVFRRDTGLDSVTIARDLGLRGMPTSSLKRL